MGYRADVPDVAQDFARVTLQERGQLAVVSPGARDGAFVNFAFRRAESGRLGRQVGERVCEADVPLALLLGIVEGVRVQERPDELPADVFESKFKMRVLIDRVMAAEKRGRADL